VADRGGAAQNRRDLKTKTPALTIRKKSSIGIDHRDPILHTEETGILVNKPYKGENRFDPLHIVTRRE